MAPPSVAWPHPNCLDGCSTVFAKILDVNVAQQLAKALSKLKLSRSCCAYWQSPSSAFHQKWLQLTSQAPQDSQLALLLLCTVSQTQANESECERRRAIRQRAGSCFIVDGSSRIADEERMKSWTQMVISKKIAQRECKEEAREFREVKYKVQSAEYNHRQSEYITSLLFLKETNSPK